MAGNNIAQSLYLGILGGIKKGHPVMGCPFIAIFYRKLILRSHGDGFYFLAG